MWEYVCVYTHRDTHTPHIWGNRLWAQGRVPGLGQITYETRELFSPKLFGYETLSWRVPFSSETLSLNCNFKPIWGAAVSENLTKN